MRLPRALYEKSRGSAWHSRNLQFLNHSASEFYIPLQKWGLIQVNVANDDATHMLIGLRQRRSNPVYNARS